MKSNLFIEVDLLEERLAKNNSSDKYSIIAQKLLDAIRDWPSDVKEINQFLEILSQTVEGVLSKRNIERYANSISYTTNAWKSESIASILEVFQYDEAKLLDEIVREISEHFIQQEYKGLFSVSNEVEVFFSEHYIPNDKEALQKLITDLRTRGCSQMQTVLLLINQGGMTFKDAGLAVTNSRTWNSTDTKNHNK